jgi:hypothetical protein
MQRHPYRNSPKNAFRLIIGLGILIVLLIAFIFYLKIGTESTSPSTPNGDAPIPLEEIGMEEEDSVHVATGLVVDEGLNIVIANCTACHSAKLITQNRADKEGWRKMIRWMQETQNLWDLGENEEIILNYLSENYAPEKRGRRAPLEDIEWYELK